MQRPNVSQMRLFVALGVAVLVLLYSMRSSNRPTRAPQATTEKPKAKAAQVETLRTLRAAAPSDATFGRYEVIASRNIFSPPAPPAPKETKPESVPPLPKPVQVQVPVVEPRPTGPPPPPPLTGWAYVGYVVIGGKKLGIMQNDGATTTENAEVGTQFHGYTVESADHEQIVLTSGGSKQVLKKPDVYQLVPLGGAVVEAGQRAARQ